MDVLFLRGSLTRDVNVILVFEDALADGELDLYVCRRHTR